MVSGFLLTTHWPIYFSQIVYTFLWMKKIIKLLPDTVLRVFDTLFCFKNVLGSVSRALDVELLQTGAASSIQVPRVIFLNVVMVTSRLLSLAPLSVYKYSHKWMALGFLIQLRFCMSQSAISRHSTSRRLWGPWLGAV